jgi:predicted nucleic acid-binding Zn ribbon protein
VTIKEVEKVECLLNCPNCGKEILDEDASFCPKCGESLEPEYEIQQKHTDLVLTAAMLTMIAAAFVASVGYIGIYQYTTLLAYYGSTMASELLGFLIFGVDGIIVAAFTLVGGIFMLKRKWFIFSMLGAIFPLVSIFVTYISIQHYHYGFTDILLFTEISATIFSIMSILLIFKSKAEFA